MPTLEPKELAAISRLFSSGVVRELARKGKSPLFARVARLPSIYGSVPSTVTVKEVFDFAFSVLQREGARDEYIYKAALTQRILLGTHSLQTASMLNELRIGDCKADLAILNGTATVYEVKSERDTLVRLEKQLTTYSSVFAKVCVITCEAHLGAVLSIAPKHVGISVLTKRYRISKMREAVNRPEETSPVAILDVVRTAEAVKILASLGISAPKVPNTQIRTALRDVFTSLDAVEVQEAMVRVLKQTRNLMPLGHLVDQLPASLHTAALCTPLRKSDHDRLISAINTPLKDAITWA